MIDANVAALDAGVATGVQFDGVTPQALRGAIARTIALHGDRTRWRQMQRRGMAADFSWGNSGAKYAALYKGLLG